MIGFRDPVNLTPSTGDLIETCLAETSVFHPRNTSVLGCRHQFFNPDSHQNAEFPWAELSCAVYGY